MNFSISEIKDIVSTISAYEDMDYSGYSISFLKRRLSDIFGQLNIKRIDTFYEQLKDKEVRDRIIGEIFVETTELFRDPSFWRYVRENVLNLLPENSTIWFPNEASGEEIYSLSILLNEQKLTDKIKILCNNPSEHCCNKIRSGAFLTKNYEVNQSNYKRLENLDLFESYFSTEESVQYIDHSLKDIIECKKVNYRNAVEGEKISMIFARNQALYLNHNQAEEYFDFLYEKIMNNGFLLIVIRENLPESIDAKMTLINGNEKIFKKQ
jgi:chemotaxis protein methyltransferase CheR